MRYDWKKGVGAKEFTKEFYEEIDRRFFGSAAEYLTWEKIPFETLIDFNSLKTKDVLEIGVGNGSHAALLAAHTKSFIGIDITDYAVVSTTERFKKFGLMGRILKMDAEKMDFPDESLDFIWSWGVIHHSSNTEKILKEIARVLRPKGTAAVMVYHRGWWNYYIVGFIRALISGDLIKTRSLFKSVQRFTDGAIARYYTVREWERIVAPFLHVTGTSIMGPKADLVILPGGRLKDMLIRCVPDGLARFFTHKLAMGVFLYSVLKKQ